MTRIFALIVGIDSYKSGYTWNLQSSTHDAKQIRNWLTKDLHVPSDHISLLLDRKATRENLQAELIRHFLQNPAIQPGDAMLFYFAGHGSSIEAPPGWYETDDLSEEDNNVVNVLCTYDHDCRRKDGSEGRTVGISDRALLSFMDDLAIEKGNNITLILDTCFAADMHSSKRLMHLSDTRWTKTVKAGPSDLQMEAESGISTSFTRRSRPGFSQTSSNYSVIAACLPGERAAENKVGGRFTSSLLNAVRRRLLISQLSWETVLNGVAEHTGDPQHPSYSGPSLKLPIFGTAQILRGTPTASFVARMRHGRRLSVARLKDVLASRPSVSFLRSRSESL